MKCFSIITQNLERMLKKDPNQPRWQIFFDVLPRKYFLKYDLLVRIAFSFLFMVFLGLGPAIASYTYIMREHANERPCMLTSDFFFERFKA